MARDLVDMRAMVPGQFQTALRDAQVMAKKNGRGTPILEAQLEHQSLSEILDRKRRQGAAEMEARQKGKVRGELVQERTRVASELGEEERALRERTAASQRKAALGGASISALATLGAKGIEQGLFQADEVLGGADKVAPDEGEMEMLRGYELPDPLLEGGHGVDPRRSPQEHVIDPAALESRLEHLTPEERMAAGTVADALSQRDAKRAQHRAMMELRRLDPRITPIGGGEY